MVAAEPWSGMVHGYRGRRRGLERGTNGMIGSQSTFPERDYSASLTRPLLMISFFGGPRKVNLLTVQWRCRIPSVGLIQGVFYFLREGCGSGPKLKVRNVLRPQHNYIHVFIFEFCHMKDEPYTIAITGGMGHKGRAAARPRTLRGAWID